MRAAGGPPCWWVGLQGPRVCVVAIQASPSGTKKASGMRPMLADEPLYSGPMRAIRVLEPFHSLFYAPLYVALGLGHFRDEGLEVTPDTPPQSGGTIAALLDGSSEICLGGIMRSLDVADRGGGFLPHFIEVNSRNGFFLLSRTPRPGFRWPD